MIEIKNLTKIYKSKKGIFDVSFTVNKGEVFGFLGPNGAGKTTTIRQLLGFTNADSGTCMIDGFDTRIDADKVQYNLGYVPGEIAFFDKMTGKEFLNFIADLHNKGIPKRKDELIKLFELETDGVIKKMSKGMKQKLALVAAFMHDPKILILDEPTSGLDPLMQKRFLDLIISEKKKGKTILMSSHNFEEVTKTCERAAMIKDGKIIKIENIANLKTELKKSFIVSFSDSKAETILRDSKLKYKKVSNLQFEISVSNNYDLFIKTLSKCHITNIDSPMQSLEQIFIHYYGKDVD